MERAPTGSFRVQVNFQPLPRRPPPIQDELLSSWIARLAQANHCCVEELCGYLGLERGRVPETVDELSRVNLDRLSFAVQRTHDEISAMTLADDGHFPFRCLAGDDFQRCPGCTEQTPGLALRHWRYVWSLACETCGRELAPMYPAGPGAEIVSDKLAARACRGAEVLKSTFADGDLKAARRIRLATNLMSSLELVHATSLTSGNKVARFTMLGVIGTCTLRPLLKVALVVRRNAGAARHLRQVFPQHRRAIAKIVGLSLKLDEKFPWHPKSKSAAHRQIGERKVSTASKHAFAAARQAIEELGPTADRRLLLVRAEAIWTSKKKPTALKDHSS